MRILRLFIALISLIFTLSAARGAADSSAAPAEGSLVPAKEVDSGWLSKARADYPTTNCVVSDEALNGGMGGPLDWVYRQTGKPDRLVRFCCKNCVRDFRKDPVKFLSKIDAARSAPGTAAPATKSGDTR